MSKLVTIYERKGKLLIAASHKTEAGFWIADKATAVVDAGDEVAVEGAIVAALAISREGIPTPPRDADHASSLLAAAGVSTWSTFSKLAKCVDVHAKDGVIEVTPYKNMGGSDGFDPQADKVISLPEGAPGLGAAVLAALKLAE